MIILTIDILLIAIEVQKDTWLIDLGAKLFLIGAIFKYSVKIQIFWEGHKYLKNLPLCFDVSKYFQKR